MTASASCWNQYILEHLRVYCNNKYSELYYLLPGSSCHMHTIILPNYNLFSGLYPHTLCMCAFSLSTYLGHNCCHYWHCHCGHKLSLQTGYSHRQSPAVHSLLLQEHFDHNLTELVSGYSLKRVKTKISNVTYTVYGNCISDCQQPVTTFNLLANALFMELAKSLMQNDSDISSPERLVGTSSPCSIYLFFLKCHKIFLLLCLMSAEYCWSVLLVVFSSHSSVKLFFWEGAQSLSSSSNAILTVFRWNNSPLPCRCIAAICSTGGD